MPMEAFLWMFLPVFVAGGSALLSYYVMQARMEVALAKERESLAEARAAINSHKITVEERVKATEEACKRQALDDFMHDIRLRAESGKTQDHRRIQKRHVAPDGKNPCVAGRRQPRIQAPQSRAVGNEVRHNAVAWACQLGERLGESNQHLREETLQHG